MQMVLDGNADVHAPAALSTHFEGHVCRGRSINQTMFTFRRPARHGYSELNSLHGYVLHPSTVPAHSLPPFFSSSGGRHSAVAREGGVGWQGAAGEVRWS
jgi:hypothetical protein